MIRGIFIVKMSRRMGRGQTGLELIVGVAFIVMIFAVMVLLAMDKMAESSRIKSFLDARRIAGSVGDNINTIAQQGPGYYTYFSLPTHVQGGYEYDIHVGGNVLDMTWADSTWSENLLSSNVTIYCISKGGNTRNRVFYGGEGIMVTCHLPNLKVDEDSLTIGVNTSSFDLVNDAHVPSGAFKVMFEANNTTENRTIMRLSAGQSLRMQFNISVAGNVSVYVDYLDVVNESIESDNNVTRYL